MIILKLDLVLISFGLLGLRQQQEKKNSKKLPLTQWENSSSFFHECTDINLSQVSKPPNKPQLCSNSLGCVWKNTTHTLPAHQHCLRQWLSVSSVESWCWCEHSWCWWSYFSQYLGSRFEYNIDIWAWYRQVRNSSWKLISNQATDKNLIILNLGSESVFQLIKLIELCSVFF